jgi:hypothetical protein
MNFPHPRPLPSGRGYFLEPKIKKANRDEPAGLMDRSWYPTLFVLGNRVALCLFRQWSSAVKFVLAVARPSPEPFTTGLGRESPDHKGRNISRKDAKHILSHVEGAAKEKRSELGVLGTLARIYPVLIHSVSSARLGGAISGCRVPG